MVAGYDWPQRGGQALHLRITTIEEATHGDRDDPLMRLYTLYPTGGGFSNKTIDYRGIELSVAADSIKQAFFFAYKKARSAGPLSPAGIVEFYQRSGDDRGWHQLWCGCRMHRGIGLRNGMTKTEIVAAMRSHTCGGA